MEGESFILNIIECLLMVAAGMGLLFLIAVICLGVVKVWDNIWFWIRGV